MRGGAGTALVGDGPTVAARINEYAALGIDSFVLSGYPHLEEAYKVGELLFPHLMSLYQKFRSRSASINKAKRWQTNLSHAKSRKAKEPADGNAEKQVVTAPRALVFTGWVGRALAARIINGLVVHPHPALSGGRCRSLLDAFRQRRALAASGDQLGARW